MVCKTHLSHNGVNTCSKCGEWICEDCSVDLNGRIFCKDCLSRSMHVPKTEAAATGCPGVGAACSRRHFSWGLTFLFSLILPGLSYMYLGLVKRGVFALSTFFISAYVASSFNLGIIGLLIPILWLGTAFDAFNLRRRLNAGEHIEDNVDDALCTLKRHRVPLILLGGFLLCSNIISQLCNFAVSRGSMFHNTVISVGRGYAYTTPASKGVWMIGQLFSNVAPLIFIVGIGYLLFKILHKKPRADRAYRGDVVETRDDDTNR